MKNKIRTLNSIDDFYLINTCIKYYSDKMYKQKNNSLVKIKLIY